MIYVVDATDDTNALASKMEFFNMSNHADLENVPILILANKSDLPNAKPDSDIGEYLDLPSIKHHEWHIQKCCGLTGEGLNEGIEWLISKISGKEER